MGHISHMHTVAPEKCQKHLRKGWQECIIESTNCTVVPSMWKWATSAGSLFLSVENRANDQSLIFDTVMFAVTTAVSQTVIESQY